MCWPTLGLPSGGFACRRPLPHPQSGPDRTWHERPFCRSQPSVCVRSNFWVRLLGSVSMKLLAAKRVMDWPDTPARNPCGARAERKGQRGHQHTGLCGQASWTVWKGG